MAAFKEVLFPPTISYGSSGGPKFKTDVFTSDSGYEQRNIAWRNVRCEFDVSQGIRKNSQMDQLLAFFMAMRGRAYGFRYKDWTDFRFRGEVCAVGTGESASLQIEKTYSYTQVESGETVTYKRKITKIAWNTIAGVAINGVPHVGWSVNHNTGIITLSGGAPAEGALITIGSGEFHVPCRFDTDHIDITQEHWDASTWPSIPIVEIRDWGEALAEEE